MKLLPLVSDFVTTSYKSLTLKSSRQLFVVALLSFGVLSACGGGGSDTDDTPNAFSFLPRTEVFLSTAIVSGEITVSGIDIEVPISVTTGEYAIDGGSYTSAEGVVSAGQTITVRATSSAELDASTTVTLDINGVTAGFELTTHSTEPSGLFEGTGTVNGSTALVDVKAMIYNEHFILFDEATRLLYDGNILTYDDDSFTAELDVYFEGLIVTGDKVGVTGTITPQDNIHFTLNGSDYGSGSIDVEYNSLFERGATQERFSAVMLEYAWFGSVLNTVTIRGTLALFGDDDNDDFTGETLSGPGCDYDGERGVIDTNANLYQLSFNSADTSARTCDHIGTDYQGFASIIDKESSTGGKYADGTDELMWFAASNGEFSTFSILSYIDDSL